MTTAAKGAAAKAAPGHKPARARPAKSAAKTAADNAAVRTVGHCQCRNIEY